MELFIFYDSIAVVWEAGVKIEDLEVSLFIFFDILEDTVSSCVFSCCD